MESKKIVALITGVSRFDDCGIISMLLTGGFKVRVASTNTQDRVKYTCIEKNSESDDLQWFDIKDQFSWDKAFEGSQYVFHGMSGRVGGSNQDARDEIDESIEESKFILGKCQVAKTVQKVILLSQSPKMDSDMVVSSSQSNSLFNRLVYMFITFSHYPHIFCRFIPEQQTRH
jgi:hypothetical protein